MSRLKSFTRRLNSDSTTDSICNKCSMVIARNATASVLKASEEGHLCDPRDLTDRLHTDSQRGTF